MFQKRKAFFIAFIALVILTGAGVVSFQGAFVHGNLASPLAQTDPVKDLNELLEKKHIALSQSPIVNNSVISVKLATTDTEVLISQQKDLVLAVDSLQIILNKLTIEVRKPKKIDLRFDDPVVIY